MGDALVDHEQHEAGGNHRKREQNDQNLEHARHMNSVPAEETKLRTPWECMNKSSSVFRDVKPTMLNIHPLTPRYVQICRAGLLKKCIVDRMIVSDNSEIPTLICGQQTSQNCII